VNQVIARPGALPLVGGELAFDFANTTSGRGSSKHLEHFRTPVDVIAWARHAKVITDRDRDAALAAIAGKPALGRRLLREALASREIIHRIGVAISQGKKPAATDLSALTAAHTRTLAVAQLTPFADGFVWSWAANECVVEAVLGPITLSALTLLTQQDLSRIKQCQGEHCGWLFFDTTKNKNRRWCEMEVCGNRAKQKQFAERHLQKENKSASSERTA
jgi:predicted RNA-binding Zn ribbon-like protein